MYLLQCVMFDLHVNMLSKEQNYALETIIIFEALSSLRDKWSHSVGHLTFCLFCLCVCMCVSHVCCDTIYNFLIIQMAASNKQAPKCNSTPLLTNKKCIKICYQNQNCLCLHKDYRDLYLQINHYISTTLIIYDKYIHYSNISFYCIKLFFFIPYLIRNLGCPES